MSLLPLEMKSAVCVVLCCVDYCSADSLSRNSSKAPHINLTRKIEIEIEACLCVKFYALFSVKDKLILFLSS